MYTYYTQMYIYIFAYVCVMYTHVYIYVHIYMCVGMLYIHTHLCVCERVCISGKIIEKNAKLRNICRKYDSMLIFLLCSREHQLNKRKRV